MRKIKEVLRLRFDLGLNQDQIARSCSIGQATVHRYLDRAAAHNLGWPLPDDVDDRRLNELLFPARPLWPQSKLRLSLDFGQIHSQLQTHKHLTLQLLWEEYRETQPSGYGYSRFCELYQRWNRSRDACLPFVCKNADRGVGRKEVTGQRRQSDPTSSEDPQYVAVSDSPTSPVTLSVHPPYNAMSTVGNAMHTADQDRGSNAPHGRVALIRRCMAPAVARQAPDRSSLTGYCLLILPVWSDRNLREPQSSLSFFKKKQPVGFLAHQPMY